MELDKPTSVVYQFTDSQLTTLAAEIIKRHEMQVLLNAKTKYLSTTDAKDFLGISPATFKKIATNKANGILAYMPDGSTHDGSKKYKRYSSVELKRYRDANPKINRLKSP